jgi:hypothetical protein
MRHLAAVTAMVALALALQSGDTSGGEELLDTGAFGPTGSLAEARIGHTATRLPGGRVVVIGGSDGRLGLVGPAETWDPTTGTFGPAQHWSAAPTSRPTMAGAPSRRPSSS